MQKGGRKKWVNAKRWRCAKNGGVQKKGVKKWCEKMM